MEKYEVFQIVKENCKEVLPELEGHDFSGSDKLVELGANSIDRSEIISLSLEKIALDIPRTELNKANNIGELVEILYEKIS